MLFRLAAQGPGGGIDIIACIVAARLSGIWGVSNNRAGINTNRIVVFRKKTLGAGSQK